MTPQRRTAQKQAVFDALCALDHPSATEVFEYLQGREPAVSRGTVFRALAAFSESGKVKKLRLLGDEAHYDSNTSPHAHARCRLCGRVWDIENVPLPRSLPAGFCPEACEVEVSGVCDACGCGR